MCSQLKCLHVEFSVLKKIICSSYGDIRHRSEVVALKGCNAEDSGAEKS